MVRWIEWQVGSGRTRAEAEREVASATNGEPGAVRAWKSSLAQVYGSERMRHELEWAREVGRCQANGITYSDLRPSTSDRDFLLQQAWTFERDLYKLAAQLNSVRGKRKTAK